MNAEYPTEDRTQARAHELPEGDIIRILLEQHGRIRELFEQVTEASGDRRKELFDELRALLAVHETAEEMVLRPMSAKAAGDVSDARNAEEAEANKLLAELEEMEPDSQEFGQAFANLRADVEKHAEAEEEEEFPQIVANCSTEERTDMGGRLRAVEKVAPTHPHPSTAGSPAAQWTVGPFASMVDRVRDAFGS